MFNLFFIQAAQTAPKQNPMTSLIFFAAIIVIFYFFMIRPQMKRQKELKNYREGLKKGDKVITAGGIYGRIIEVNDTSIMLEIDQNVKIRVDKGSVVRNAEDIADQPKQ